MVEEVKKENISEKSPQWYWEDNNYRYVKYDASSSSLLEKAYASKTPTLQLSVKGRSYEVDLTNLTQRNLKTKVARKVRRITEIPSQITHEWHFYNEDSKAAKGFEPYSPSDSDALEKAYLSKCPTWNLVIKGKLYEIDFGKMVQINIITGYKRKVMRVLKDTPTATLLCKICCTMPQEVIFLPCGHLGSCKECSKKMHGNCPFCGLPYTLIRDAYQP